MYLKCFKNRFLHQVGFTTIELMISVLIVGIVAIVALPEFQEYKNEARRAEAYIYVDAIQKASAINHASNGYFVPSGTYRFDDYLPQPGEKGPIYYEGIAGHEGTEFSHFRSFYTGVSDVIPEGSLSYFGYIVYGGEFTDSGNAQVIASYSEILDENGEVPITKRDTGSSALSVDYTVSLTSSGGGNFARDTCSFPLDFAGTGLNVGGEGYSVVGAFRSTGEDGCESIIQAQVTSDGIYLRSPIASAQMDSVCTGPLCPGGGGGDSGDSGDSGDEKGDSGKDSGDEKGDSGKDSGDEKGDSGKDSGDEKGDTGKDSGSTK